MTIPQLLVFLGGALIGIGGVVAILTSWAFCVRPAPREIRITREIWLAAAGIAAATLVASGDERALLARGIFMLGTGVFTCLIAGYNFVRVLGPRGDRCSRMLR